MATLFTKVITNSFYKNLITLYGEEFPNLKYPLPLTFWSNLST